MRILYIHQLFKTPEEGGGIRSWYLAKSLVEAGHHVDLVSSHNYFQGSRVIDGIHVHYIKVSYDNSFGFLRRLWSYGLFVLKARSMAKSFSKADMAYIMTTPLTTGFIATWIKRKLDVPYIFEVGDLWPDVPIEMGVINNRLLISWLYRKEKQFYDSAVKVVALSPDIQKNIEGKTGTEVEMIPNLSDPSFFQPSFRKHEITTLHPLKILYCGAHGRANQLEFLVDAARETLDLPISYTFMGQGAEKAKIMSYAHGLQNITFKDHGSKEEVRDTIQNHDALYISFQELPTLHTGSPNKFFDALAAGKMVISNLSGWTGDLIQSKKIGFAYTGSSPETFKEEIKNFLELGSLLEAQKNSYALSEDYSREKLTKRFLKTVEGSININS